MDKDPDPKHCNCKDN